MGGYLSRVSARRIAEMRSNAVINALMILSENRAIDVVQRDALLRDAMAFIHENNIGFVVIDRARASDELRNTAIRAFALECVDTDGVFDLYVPRLPG
jgi:hypothetical protein